jgi:hypothetical protein
LKCTNIYWKHDGLGIGKITMFLMKLEISLWYNFPVEYYLNVEMMVNFDFPWCPYDEVPYCIRTHFESAEMAAGLQLSVTGVLGFRTVHQVNTVNCTIRKFHSWYLPFNTLFFDIG